jgi:hypothetical protein
MCLHIRLSKNWSTSKTSEERLSHIRFASLRIIERYDLKLED